MASVTVQYSTNGSRATARVTTTLTDTDGTTDRFSMPGFAPVALLCETITGSALTSAALRAAIVPGGVALSGVASRTAAGIQAAAISGDFAEYTMTASASGSAGTWRVQALFTKIG
jgi:hypothetical protein